MVTIPLDPAIEQRLRAMAEVQGQTLSELAARIVEDYLDWRAWKDDTPEELDQAMMTLIAEVLPEEHWDDE